jgi:hypothetical protein
MILVLTGCASHICETSRPTLLRTAQHASRYDFYRAWAERRAAPSYVQESEPIYVMTPTETNDAEIIGYRNAITLREVIAQSAFAGTAKAVTIYRARNVAGQNNPGSGYVYDVHSPEAQHCRIEPLDVLLVHTETPVIHR